MPIYKKVPWWVWALPPWGNKDPAQNPLCPLIPSIGPSISSWGDADSYLEKRRGEMDAPRLKGMQVFPRGLILTRDKEVQDASDLQEPSPQRESWSLA